MSRASSAKDAQGRLSPEQVRAPNQKPLPTVEDLGKQIIREMMKVADELELTQEEWAARACVCSKTIWRYCNFEKQCLNWDTMELMARALKKNLCYFERMAWLALGWPDQAAFVP